MLLYHNIRKIEQKCTKSKINAILFGGKFNLTFGIILFEKRTLKKAPIKILEIANVDTYQTILSKIQSCVYRIHLSKMKVTFSPKYSIACNKSVSTTVTDRPSRTACFFSRQFWGKTAGSSQCSSLETHLGTSIHFLLTILIFSAATAMWTCWVSFIWMYFM